MSWKTIGDGASSVEVLRTHPDGRRELRVRGHFGQQDGSPLAIRCTYNGRTAIVGAANRPPVEDREDQGALDIRADSTDEELRALGTVTIRGVASSTSVDSYGTEMTKHALDRQAEQFNGGVAYAPTHAEREWHQVVGTTRKGEVVAVREVVNAYDEDEQQYVLWVTTDLDMTLERARELVRALAAGRQIGQSIGAWFTEIIWVENDSFEIVRILINDLDLDHLAGTRTPANGDSTDLQIVRSAVRSALDDWRNDTAAPARAATGGPVPDTDGPARLHGPESLLSSEVLRQLSRDGRKVTRQFATDGLELRHVVAIEDMDDTIAVTFAKDEGFESELSAADALQRVADLHRRHFVTVSEEDDTVTVWFERSDETTEDDTDGDDDRSAEPPSTREDPEDDATGDDPADREAGDTPDDGGDPPHSEASAEEHHSEEIDMTDEQLEKLSGAVAVAVVQALSAAGALPAAGDGDGAGDPDDNRSAAPTGDDAARASDTDPKSAPPAPASRAADAQRAEDPPTVADLRAENERLKARQAQQDVTIQRLLDHPVRSTGGTFGGGDDMSMLDEQIALASGDLSPLIERAREGGIRPTLVRTVEKDRKVQKILTAEENPMTQITRRDLRDALKSVVRAYGRDGGLTSNRNPWRR